MLNTPRSFPIMSRICTGQFSLRLPTVSHTANAEANPTSAVFNLGNRLQMLVSFTSRTFSR